MLPAVSSLISGNIQTGVELSKTVVSFAEEDKMTKKQRDAPGASRGIFDDPMLSVMLIMVIGIAVRAIAPEEFEYWFPAAVIMSGLLIVLGEFFIKWLGKRRQ